MAHTDTTEERPIEIMRPVIIGALRYLADQLEAESEEHVLTCIPKSGDMLSTEVIIRSLYKTSATGTVSVVRMMDETV